jgi:hypothetical protein
VAKISGKQERDEKNCSRPRHYKKGAREDYSTAKYIEEREQATSDREVETLNFG